MFSDVLIPLTTQKYIIEKTGPTVYLTIYKLARMNEMVAIQFIITFKVLEFKGIEKAVNYRFGLTLLRFAIKGE